MNMISRIITKRFLGFLFVLSVFWVSAAPTEVKGEEDPPDLVILYTSDGRGRIKCSG